MTIAVFVLAAAMAGASQSAQHTHGSEVDRRGTQVMGFDQEKTTHHFLLYEDGGAIDVSVKEAADTENLGAIRAHLPHVAAMFTAGDFDAPMLVHGTKVPGTTEMAAMKERITYRFAQTAKGGRVDITTTDPAAVAAVHRFLRFQISDHRTGDSGEVRKR